MTTCEHDCEFCERLPDCHENAAERYRSEAREVSVPNPLAALEARMRGLDSDLQDLRANVETLAGEWHRVIAAVVSATGSEP